jgi:cytochrome c-type biogenesis protein CcmH/NrfG
LYVLNALHVMHAIDKLYSKYFEFFTRNYFFFMKIKNKIQPLSFAIFAMTFVLLGCGTKPEPESAIQTSVAPKEEEAAPEIVQDELEPVALLPEELVHAASLYNEANYEEARLGLEPYLLDNPEDFEALLLLTKIDIALQRAELAKFSVERALRLKPENAAALLLAAKIEFAQRRDAEAMALLEKAEKSDSEMIEIPLLAAKIAFNYLDYEKALVFAKKAFSLDPSAQAASFAYADALYAQKNYAHAAELYEKALTQKAASEKMETELALKRLAAIYEEQLQNAEGACSAYSRLLAIDAENKIYQASKDYHCKP